LENAGGMEGNTIPFKPNIFTQMSELKNFAMTKCVKFEANKALYSSMKLTKYKEKYELQNSFVEIIT
jgi:hypothetical protein